jgi:hypothetical protein
LRAGLRRFTCVLLLEQLLADESMDAAGCWEVYKTADDWFRSLLVSTIIQDPVAPPDSVNVSNVSTNHSVPEMAAAALKCVARGQMQLEGGPVGRARRLFWLCVDPYLRESGDAVEWACTLCREFALGGPLGLLAASTLFEDVIPSAISISHTGHSVLDTAPTSITTLCSAASENNTHWAAELQGWAGYFELLGEYESWRSLYEDIMGPEAAEVDLYVEGFRQDSAQLFKACVDFVLQGVDWVRCGGVDEGVEEIAVVLGPAGYERGGFVGQGGQGGGSQPGAEWGTEYATFPSTELRDSFCAPVSKALHSFADGLVTFYAGASPEHSGASFPGLISVAADCQSAAEVQLAAKALARLLKDGSENSEFKSDMIDVEYPASFIATNVSGSQTFVALLCRRMIWTRMVLATLILRKALLLMALTDTSSGTKSMFENVAVEREAEDGFSRVVDALGGCEDWFSPLETENIRNLLAELTELSKHRRKSLDLGSMGE